MPRELLWPIDVPAPTLHALNSLHNAIAAGDLAAVNDWLTTDVPLDLPVGQHTVLTRAAQDGHTALLPVLVGRMQAAGLDPDEEVHLVSHRPDEPTRSVIEVIPRPLMVALQHQHLPTLRCLLDLGADPNAPVSQGSHTTLPLMQAVRTNQGEAIDLLVEFLADPNQADGMQQAPLHQAALMANGGLLRRLMMHGANPNLAARRTGNTPLHILMENWRSSHADHLDSVQALMQYGANPWLHNLAGKSVWDLAPDSALPVLTRAWAEQEKVTLHDTFAAALASTPIVERNKPRL